VKKTLGAVVLVLFLICIAAGMPQNRNQQSSPPPYVPQTAAPPSPRQLEPQFPMPTPQDEGANPRDIQRGLAIARNKEIKQETDHLLELATELKKTVDASVSTDTLSMQAIKQTDEIEKLAKKVRNKMKESYRDSPGPR
jgi:hypothetical protein